VSRERTDRQTDWLQYFAHSQEKIKFFARDWRRCQTTHLIFALVNDESVFYVTHAVLLVIGSWSWSPGASRETTFPSVPSTHRSHRPPHPYIFIPHDSIKPSFSANPSHRSLNSFSSSDWLHRFPGLFTDTSKHIRLFYFLVFFCFHLFSCWFRAVD